MIALPAADAEQLAGLADLLASGADSARLAAIQAATALLDSHGLTWRDVLASPSNDNPPADALDHVVKAKFCLARFGVWSGVELSMLYNLRKLRREPSEKQGLWLDKLYERALLIPECEARDGDKA